MGFFLGGITGPRSRPGLVRPPAGGVRVRPHGLVRRPSVSVVTTCYNYGDLLPGSVSSALGQAGVDVDVTIVENGSTDGSPAVARELARGDARVHLVELADNIGAVRGFNLGLAATTGDYVVRLDPDDLLTPGSLARSAALLDHFPDVGMAYGNVVHFSAAVPRTSGSLRGWTLWTGRDWLSRRYRTATNCISSPEVLMRGDLARELGGFRLDLAHTPDLNMWLRIAARGGVGHVDGADQALFRKHERSLSAREHSALLVEMRQRRAAFDAAVAEPVLDPATRARLRAAAHDALAAEALELIAYDRHRTDGTPAADLLAFARETVPDVTRLREWTAVAYRRRHGPVRLPFVSPAYVARATGRRLATASRYRTQRRYGV